jgi:hypothetical protein
VSFSDKEPGDVQRKGYLTSHICSNIDAHNVSDSSRSLGSFTQTCRDVTAFPYKRRLSTVRFPMRASANKLHRLDTAESRAAFLPR